MSDYIQALDCWHWQHYWSSPWTKRIRGGLLPATPPNAGFAVAKPPTWEGLASITAPATTRTAPSAPSGPLTVQSPMIVNG